MIFKSEKAGTFPAGCHWAAGDVRKLDVKKGVDVPSWLVEVKAKAKSKKTEPKTDEG